MLMPTPCRTPWFAVIAATFAAAGVHAQASGAPGSAPAVQAPYITRGREVEARQRVLGERVTRFHDALAAELRRSAPDLLPKLEPPPAIVTGYQLLPRITPSPAPQPQTAPAPLVSYSWRWSETLMDQETAAVGRLEATLTAASARRSTLDSLTTSYRALVDRKRGVDADVNYNWLWQGEITRVRPVFDRNSAIMDAILRLRSARVASDSALVAEGLASDVSRVDPPAYVTAERRGDGWLITVPIVTDIQDTAFVAEFKRVIVAGWRARDSVSYQVALDVRVVPPAELYCAASASCAPPARGAQINMGAHIARFPQGAAVLTTGAGSTHFEGGRAVVLSPHDAPHHLFVHEFGHVLGFRDAYLRGYRDAGNDGFVVTELVVDARDVMGNSRDGSVNVSHFERLLRAKEAPAVMRAALGAFYERANAAEAVPLFRKVLAAQPNHYGAMYQLAKALDVTGARVESTQWWTRVLAEARLVGDTVTAKQASQRLSTPSPR
jgi:hypothetical protein